MEFHRCSLTFDSYRTSLWVTIIWVDLYLYYLGILNSRLWPEMLFLEIFLPPSALSAIYNRSISRTIFSRVRYDVIICTDFSQNFLEMASPGWIKKIMNFIWLFFRYQKFSTQCQNFQISDWTTINCTVQSRSPSATVIIWWSCCWTIIIWLGQFPRV